MSFHPRTPQSPSQVSPANSSDAINPNSTTMTANTLPTPAHSVTGSTSQTDIAANDDSPNKRKRALEDEGERDSKKVQLEGHRLGIEDLHLDVGEKYLLCQTPHLESLPRMTEDLYEMFNLTSLASQVAREKPNGEKNALRKTYKGHLKRLGVAGSFGEHKKPEGAQSEFMALVYTADEDWHSLEVNNREIGKGLSSATLAALPRAMTMAKGSLPKDVWDTSVLGDLAPFTGDGSKLSGGKLATPGTPLGGSTPTNIARPKQQLAAGQDPSRTRGNKRSYKPDSYDGYRGYADDDDAAGYSTGEGEGSQKRRKKNAGNASPYPNPMRQQSYGPGMVGA
uniref:Mediator of RNA polymerase II transcription subunit 19 n=1 Tax=Bionectria ochroleuca TaxID=29856 RepID=A0A0B7KFN7_BIOOC